MTEQIKNGDKAKTKRTTKRATSKKKAIKNTPAKAKEKKVVDLKVKCACGKIFERSIYSTNQKDCPKCAKRKKLDRIKARNKLKRRVCTVKRFTDWAKKNKVAETKLESILKDIQGHSVSETFQYYKTKYPKYVESVK